MEHPPPEPHQLVRGNSLAEMVQAWLQFVALEFDQGDSTHPLVPESREADRYRATSLRIVAAGGRACVHRWKRRTGHRWTGPMREGCLAAAVFAPRVAGTPAQVNVATRQAVVIGCRNAPVGVRVVARRDGRGPAAMISLFAT